MNMIPSDWKWAAQLCMEKIPQFQNLTTPAQGMMIGCLLDRFEARTWTPLMVPVLIPDYDTLLKEVESVWKMHGEMGWGFEK